MGGADQPVTPKFYDHEYDSLRQMVCLHEVCDDRTVADLYLGSDSSPRPTRRAIFSILDYQSRAPATDLKLKD